MRFSIIIPVYNRPDEIDELLQSIVNQNYSDDYEVIIVEDGSDVRSDKVTEKYVTNLDIKYFFKTNSGPGQSRNYGMQRAKGNYLIILDSDVILPENYLVIVTKTLQKQYTDAYGGPDAASPEFTALQKGINYAMTSFLTTGGLRGRKGSKEKFQLRSFNLGLSKKAFTETGGFSKQHFGEDIDLTFRLWKAGLSSQFIEEAYVYHKRRTSYRQFFRQTFNFGAARPILNKMHPGSSKLTYWFPSVFITGLIFSFLFFFYGMIMYHRLFLMPLLLYGIYFLLIFFNAISKEYSYTKGFSSDKKIKSPVLQLIKLGFSSVAATLVQFMGYGSGFLRSFLRSNILGRSERETFPEMFS